MLHIEASVMRAAARRHSEHICELIDYVRLNNKRSDEEQFTSQRNEILSMKEFRKYLKIDFKVHFN